MKKSARRQGVTIAMLVGAATAGHVLYPAWLAWATRGRADQRRVDPNPVDPEVWPAITVLVPAYREANVISDKIEDVRANCYPGSLDIVVIADGDPETAAAAEGAGARTITGPERLGKSQALNRGFAEVRTPIVVISDANNRLLPGALSALVRHFDDSRVGAVTGEKVVDDGGGGESLYWRFESWLKRREDRLGTTIGLVGELAAFRREAWRPIPVDIASDDLWAALDIIEQGYRIAYEPMAQAVDPAVPTLAAEWERRTRIASGALHVLVRRRHQLRPSAGLVAVEIWGHRLIRYTVGPIAHLVLLGIAVRRVRSSRVACLFLIGHVWAGFTLARRAVTPATSENGGGRLHRPFQTAAKAAAQVLFLQGVALGGMFRYLRGDRQTKWSTIER
jgi:biofilm PGA synthesis N-glycosyltransferase PgaC